MEIDERGIEALARNGWYERAKTQQWHQSWEETRADNREYCRNHVKEKIIPYVEIYLEAVQPSKSSDHD